MAIDHPQLSQSENYTTEEDAEIQLLTFPNEMTFATLGHLVQSQKQRAMLQQHQDDEVSKKQHLL